MADVISSGAEPAAPRRRIRRWPRPPNGQWRPPAWLVVLMVAVVLAGTARLVGGTLTSGEATRSRLATPTARPTLVQLSAPPNARAARFRLDGRPGGGPPGLRLLVGGDRPAVVVASTGQTQPLPGLRLADGQHVAVTRLPHATAALVSDRDYRPAGAYLLPDGGGAILLGRDLTEVVAARDGGVIATASGWAGGRGRIASFAADGRLRWQRPLSAPALLRRDTPYGLLIQVIPVPDVGGGPLLLVDARTGTIRRAFGQASYVLDSSDDRVAWVLRGCAEGCPLQVSELATGHTERHMLPDSWQPSYAAFSPRQTMLALSFSGRHEFVPGTERDGYVAVLSLVTGQLERMPGLTTEAKQAATLAWTPAGALVLGLTVYGVVDRLLVWTPGWPAPTVLPRPLPTFSAAASIAVLP